MSKVKAIIRRVKNPEFLLLDFRSLGLIKMSDKKYLELHYKSKFGYLPDLENPKTFNEKIQWMKLYYRKPELAGFVDKAEAKKRVAKIIGDQYIIPTIGVYDNFDEIDFDKLPNQFVIKCTHDCASVIICRDKNKFDIDDTRKRINKALKVKYYGKNDLEWVYSQIKPRIIVEKFMKNKETDDIIDYKFFCFNGEPKVMYISSGLEDHATASISFADMNYKLLDIERADYKALDKLPPKPESFEEMKRIAKKLSKGFPEVRVDLYEINGKPYFGELTFYTCGGMVPWKKHEYDERLGRMIKLPRKEYDK
jgi:hypothetical protein